MNDGSPINAETVRALAATADLPLDAERAAAVAEGLSAWIPTANELSQKMSAPEHRELIPITVFAHRDPELTE
jgi:hypothetical protein